MLSPSKLRLLFILLITCLLLGLILAVNGLNSTRLGAPFSARCDLNQGPCVTELEDGRTLRVSMNPTPAKSLTPLRFEASLEGDQPDSIWLDIQGEEMYMGLNQPEMQQDENRWTTETELAVCTTGTMLWRVTLMINDGDQQIQAPFYFEAQ